MVDNPEVGGVFRSLGAISAERFQGAADRHGLGRVLATEVLGGAHGNNVGLRTDRGDWVLRGAVGAVEVVTFFRERFFARALHGRVRLTAPWPYLVDESVDPFGWPYALMPRLPGRTVNPADRAGWLSAGGTLGRAAAELHTVTFQGIGEWSADRDDIASPGVSPADWFVARAERLVGRIARTSQPLDPASAALVDERIAGAAETIGSFEPTYVHGDLGISNFVGEPSAGGFDFTGVFDLEGGYSGDPDEDLATPLWWPLYWKNPEASRAFLAGYHDARRPRPGQAARLRGYVVVSMLTNWEFGRREGFNWYGGAETFADWALPLLQQVDSIIGK